MILVILFALILIILNQMLPLIKNTSN